MPRTTVEAVRDAPVDAPARKALARSYSTTSLPTPPRTRKRKRSGSRHSRATDSDSDDAQVPFCDSDDEELLEMERRRTEAGKGKDGERDTLVVGHKKRRMLQVDAIAAELAGREEDAFWGVESADMEEKAASSAHDTVEGPSAAQTKTKTKATDDEHERPRSKTPERSPSCSPAAHLLKRNPTGLLSPPQSRRHKSPRVLPFALPVRARAPKTPPPRRSKARAGDRSVRRRLFPERDSPNNPFLEDTKGSATAGSSSGSSPEGKTGPHTPLAYVEKPTITYVFRGVRTEFDNPLYDPRYPETGVPPPEADPDDPSKLPLDHEDYEASAYCPPKMLFPEAHQASKRKHKDTSDSEDSEFDDVRPTSSTVVAEEPVVAHGKGKRRGKGKGKVRAVTPVHEESADETEVESDKPKRKAKAKGRAAKTKKPPSKSLPSEWESTDDEGGGPDEEDEGPIVRIGLPRGFVPKPREPAVAAKPRSRASSSRKSEEPPSAGEDGDPADHAPPTETKATVKA